MPRGKSDDSSAAVSCADLETLVQKAVSAAIAVLREEFAKLFDSFNIRLKSVEERIEIHEGFEKDTKVRFGAFTDRLTGLETAANNGFGLEDQMKALESRLSALEKDQPGAGATQTDASRKLEEIQRETRTCRIAANDNEQYLRRNNLRIRGLMLNSGPTDCKLAVTEFCRTKLRITDFDEASIVEAHPLPKRQSPQGAEALSASRATTEPMVMVKFRDQATREKVIKSRRLLKGTRFAVIEDLTLLNFQTMNRLRNHADVKSTWSWNGRIYAMLNSGIRLLVKPFQSLNECVEV
jgi:hypothetical protein